VTQKDRPAVLDLGLRLSAAQVTGFDFQKEFETTLGSARVRIGRAPHHKRAELLIDQQLGLTQSVDNAVRVHKLRKQTMK
jgi:hypothetical protein